MDSDDSIPYEEDSGSDASLNEEERWLAKWQRIREDDPDTMELCGSGNNNYIDDMTDEEWERLGRDVSNNTQLREASLSRGALNDHKMTLFFRGLTRSDSIEKFYLNDNQFSVAGIRSMVPFLQNVSNLWSLDLSDNNIQSEGFNLLLRALRNSPIEKLHCVRCGIESIDIENEHIPKHLKYLTLSENNINADGCRELGKLLHGMGSTLTDLHLAGNKIDDEGVSILVDVLRNNKSLKWLNLESNDGISEQGQCMLLKLVNDISSIEATLQSNHTLKYLFVDSLVTEINIQVRIRRATQINREEGTRNPAAVGRAKMIKTQLHSGVRAELAELQGVSQSLCGEINPLHLPEVIALVCRYHDQGELYLALKSSIAGVISTVNRKQCLQQEKEYCSAIIAEYRAKMEVIEAEIATIEAAEAEGRTVDMGNESLRTNKRRRM